MTWPEMSTKPLGDRPLRLLVLFDSVFPYTGGGRETGVFHLAKHGQGLLEMKVITFKPSKGLKEIVFKEAASLFDIHPVFSWQSLLKLKGYNRLSRVVDSLAFGGRAYREGKNIAQSWRPDAVVVFNAGPVARAGIRLARSIGCLSVLNIRTLYSREHELTNPVYRPLLPHIRRIERSCIKNVDLILANGTDTHRLCQNQYKRTGPIELVHNGVDSNLFKPAQNESLREKLGLSDRIIFIANNPLREIKGPQEAMLAFSKMDKILRHKCALLFLGSGSFKTYAKLAKRLGISSQVYHIGFIPHSKMPDYLNAADIAIHPVLFSAGTTHASIETIACGLPQLSYDSAGLSATCVDGRNGFLIDRGDTASLAAAMSKLAENAELRQEMAAASRKLSLEFDWSRYVRRWVNAIRVLE